MDVENRKMEVDVYNTLDLFIWQVPLGGIRSEHRETLNQEVHVSFISHFSALTEPHRENA